MISFHSLPLEILLLLSLSAESSRAARLLNQTLDDSDASIHYSPGWSVSAATANYDFCGSHHFSYLEDANASFVFKGVAVYILSPLWPFSAAIEVAVDGLNPTILDLRDHSLPISSLDGKPSVPSKVVWGMGNLKNKEHVLTIRFANHDGDYAAVDGLIYTQVGTDVDSNIPLPRPDVLSDAVSSSVTPQPSSNPIVIGAVVGASLGLLGILLAFLYVRYRRRILLKYGHLIGIDVRHRKPPSTPPFEMLTPFPPQANPTLHKRLPSTPISSAPSTPPGSFPKHPAVTLQLSIPRRAITSPSSSFFPTPQDDPGYSSTSTEIEGHELAPSHERARVRFEDHERKQSDASRMSHGSAVVNDAGIKVHIRHQDFPTRDPAKSSFKPSLETTQKSSGMSYSFRAKGGRFDLIVGVGSDSGGSRRAERGRVRIPVRRSSLAHLMHNVSPKRTSSAFRHQRFQKTYPRRSAPMGPRDQIVNRRTSRRLRTTSMIPSVYSQPESSPSSLLSMELAALFPAPPSSIPMELLSQNLPSSSLQSPLSRQETSNGPPSLSMLATVATMSHRSYLPPSANDSRPLPLPPVPPNAKPLVTTRRRVPLPELPTRGGKGRRSPSLASVQTSAVLPKGGYSPSLASVQTSAVLPKGGLNTPTVNRRLPSPPTSVPPQSLAMDLQTRRVRQPSNMATEAPTVAPQSPDRNKPLPAILSLSPPASQDRFRRKSSITFLPPSPGKMSLSSSASLVIPPPPLGSPPPIPIPGVRRELLAPPETLPDAPQSARFTNDSFY